MFFLFSLRSVPGTQHKKNIYKLKKKRFTKRTGLPGLLRSDPIFVHNLKVATHIVAVPVGPYRAPRARIIQDYEGAGRPGLVQGRAGLSGLFPSLGRRRRRISSCGRHRNQ